MKKLKRFLAIIASVLAVSLFVSSEGSQIIAFAVGEAVIDSRLYMSEVKMFYGKSEAEAKAACEKEGFIFCPTNLNEGEAVVKAGFFSSSIYKDMFDDVKLGTYIGYKTTDDRKKAITDLTILDMKYTHFEDMDYEKYLDEHLQDFKNEAAQMMLLVNELRRKKEAGSPNAIMAYDSLNMFYVDESKSHDAETNRLGYYLINNADIAFFEKFIQRGNSMILSKITDLLCSAAADYNTEGKTWADKTRESNADYDYINSTSDIRNMYDQNCQDTAKKFVEYVSEFSSTYSQAKARFDKYGETLGYSELKGITQENGIEKLNAVGADCRFPEFSNALKNYALLDASYLYKKGDKIVRKNDIPKDTEPEEDTTDDEETSYTEESSEEDTEKDKETSDTEDTSKNEKKEPEYFYTEDLTLADYFLEIAEDETIEDHIWILYPLINSLSPAQRAAFQLGGISTIIEGLYQSEDYLSQRSQALKEAAQKLKDSGCEDGALYVWYGMDTSLYNKKVVQTDARKEAAAAGIQLDNSINEAEKNEQNTLSQVLMIVDICTLGYGGIMMIANAIIGSSIWSIGTSLLECAGMYMAAEMIGSAVLTGLAGALVSVLWILNVVAIVVGFVMLIYSILEWTGVFNQPEVIDFSNIPDVVFDARQKSTGTYSVRYDAVKSNATAVWKERLDEFDDNGFKVAGELKDKMKEDYAELNAYMGIFNRWNVLYYSKSADAGEPIEVKPGQELFVAKGDHRAPEGYRPLTLITSDSAVNVNDVEIIDKKGTPLYVFFPGKAKGTGAGVEVSDNGIYITKVRLSYSEKSEDAINLLKKDNYEYFDVNLTPYKGYTYLGYQKGSKNNALRDIRLSNSTSNSIVFGDASYGKMGKDGKGTTPDGMSLFATASESAGSLIVSISIENKRLGLGTGKEPVCLFSGGEAVDIGQKWKDNILECGRDSNVDFFLDKGGWVTYKHSSKSYPYEFLRQDDPDNGVYLYFQPKVQYKSKNENGKDAQRYIAGFSYFLAGDNKTDDDNNKYGSNYEFMQKFAKSNGFELLQKDGEAFRVMSDTAGEMTLATAWRDVGGYPADTYNFDQVHTVYYTVVSSKEGTSAVSTVVAGGDGGLIYGFLGGAAGFAQGELTHEHNEKMIFHTAMYFGVSYTYNPYRAITGISGLITPYTETSSQIKFTGMKTPAGTFQACNVSMQGSPINSAGITAGYFNPMTMSFPLYTNYEARQKYDLSWMTDKETEVMSHYLMTSGPCDGVSPLKADDITFSMEEKPGQKDDYVPLCDLRTPGDYEHPMNLALDTTNKGSKYLYLFLKKDADGRVADKETKTDSTGKVTQKGKTVLLKNNYTAKQYVAAMFCGVGKTPEEAIANLYSNAASSWSDLAEGHEDISCRPMVTEFDEIIPVDLSSEHPWYELHCNDTNINSLKNGVWVRGNELAYHRWEGHDREEKKTIDEYEKEFKCAYIGVVRTSNKSGAAYGALKYYSDGKTAPTKLTSGSTACYLAGGPVKSKEGNYFLYYSTNTGTANYQAPITSLHISSDIFINGYNTTFTVSEKDRKDSSLPQFGQLRMRTDEYRYIHLGYDRADLPYYEQLYLGVGNTKEEAFVDMIGTTNAYAAVDVNCNYNSFSKKMDRYRLSAHK